MKNISRISPKHGPGFAAVVSLVLSFSLFFIFSGHLNKEIRSWFKCQMVVFINHEVSLEASGLGSYFFSFSFRFSSLVLYKLIQKLKKEEIIRPRFHFIYFYLFFHSPAVLRTRFQPFFLFF